MDHDSSKGLDSLSVKVRGFKFYNLNDIGCLLAPYSQALQLLNL